MTPVVEYWNNCHQVLRAMKIRSANLLLLLSGSVESDPPTSWTAAYPASLSFTTSQSLLRLMAIESVMPSNHLIFCHPLFLLHSIFPSIRVFSSDSSFWIRWLKYWSFSISLCSEYSGLISFRIDWFDRRVINIFIV